MGSIGEIKTMRHKDIFKLFAYTTVLCTGVYILEHAIYNNDLVVIEILIKKGADIKKKTCYGRTLLHICASQGNTVLLRYIHGLQSINF